MSYFLKRASIISMWMALFFGAQKAFSGQLDLRSGDILLQPLDCWACVLIEAQEKSIYSHVGIYFEIDGKDFVLEALGQVRMVSLETYLEKTEKGQRVQVKRFKNIRFAPQELLESAQEFLGLSYDSSFLWDNFDAKGEKLYCSELVYKLFYAYYGEALPIKRMRYDIYRERWNIFFKGEIPDGKWGNSPEDFNLSPLLEKVGEI